MKIEIEDELLEQIKERHKDIFAIKGSIDYFLFKGFINQVLRDYLKEEE